jgi:uncharacterized surface protein with fasciclin (FAS1) repeats
MEKNKNTPQSKEGSILKVTDSRNPSQKSEIKKLKSKILVKRKSLLLPAILIFIAFIVIILAISLAGIENPIASNESVIASQKPSVVPTIGTPVPPLPVTTGASTQQTTMINAISTPVPTATVSQTPGITITTTVAPANQVGLKIIVETAKTDGRFTTFVAAMNAAGLTDTVSGDTLNGPEMFTVFIPTDDAFRKLSAGSMDALLKDPQGDLLQILLYHIVQGRVKAADLTKLTTIETLQGGSLPISVSDGVITIDNTNVIFPDIECSNGMIHGVDTVMLPPA